MITLDGHVTALTASSTACFFFLFCDFLLYYWNFSVEFLMTAAQEICLSAESTQHLSLVSLFGHKIRTMKYTLEHNLLRCDRWRKF